MVGYGVGSVACGFWLEDSLVLCEDSVESVQGENVGSVVGEGIVFVPCADVGDDVGERVGLVDGGKFELGEGEGVTMLLDFM